MNRKNVKSTTQYWIIRRLRHCHPDKQNFCIDIAGWCEGFQHQKVIINCIMRKHFLTTSSLMSYTNAECMLLSVWWYTYIILAYAVAALQSSLPACFRRRPHRPLASASGVGIRLDLDWALLSRVRTLLFAVIPRLEMLLCSRWMLDSAQSVADYLLGGVLVVAYLSKISEWGSSSAEPPCPTWSSPVISFLGTGVPVLLRRPFDHLCLSKCLRLVKLRPQVSLHDVSPCMAVFSALQSSLKNQQCFTVRRIMGARCRCPIHMKFLSI